MSIVALPDSLSRAITAESACLPRDALIHAAQSLSSSYRRKSEGLPHRLTEIERVAYAVMRMPATYAAASVALRELKRAVDVSGFNRCLDVGAGPGTASFAAHALVPSLSTIAQLERDPGWSALAQRLALAVGLETTRTIGSVAAIPGKAHDLVLAAYVLNELPADQLDSAVRALWSATSSAIVVVEPGTPQGFAVIRRVREICLELGGHAAAPCTHDAHCPMTVDDWCHRSVRVQRTALHRALKLADLAFEDEKFSYVVMARPSPQRGAPSRIVRRPIRAGGHVHLDLCSQNGLTRTTIGRADRVLYKAARDVEWGDLWPPTPDGGEAG